MPDSTFVRIDGLQQLGERMRGLKEEVNQRICRTATNKGAQFIKELAVAKAPVWPEPHVLEGVVVPSGNLKRNIVVKKVSANRSALTAEYIVTVRGKRKDAYAARYGRLVEFGTVKMAPESFLRVSFDGGKNEAADIIVAELASGIDKAVAKLK